MQEVRPPIETLQDIRKLMERSSRFISLSGWSGISAGICALIGAAIAYFRLEKYHPGRGGFRNTYEELDLDLSGIDIINELFWIAVFVFIAAFVSAFFFTYIRSKKNNIKIWDPVSRRLMWNVLIPLTVGGLCILKIMDIGAFHLVGALCLIFYGLALLNASKYTLGEIRYLAIGQLILGVICLWLPGFGLLFWAMGFGVLHIIYGVLMWRKYER